MGKRLQVLCATVAAALLVVGVVNAASGSPGGPKHQRLRVRAIVTELNRVSVGTNGPALGDQVVFSNKLLRHGKDVGHQGVVCTTVSVERNKAECAVTFALSGGQITEQALVTLGTTAPYAVAITGGSGSYEGAEGEIRVRPVSPTERILTLRIED